MNEFPSVLAWFLYDWENKHNAAPAARNINDAFGNGFINEYSIRRWYTKFKTGNESLTNGDQGRLETVKDNELLRAIIEKNPSNTVRDYMQKN